MALLIRVINLLYLSIIKLIEYGLAKSICIFISNIIVLIFDFLLIIFFYFDISQTLY